MFHTFNQHTFSMIWIRSTFPSLKRLGLGNFHSPSNVPYNEATRAKMAAVVFPHQHIAVNTTTATRAEVKMIVTYHLVSSLLIQNKSLSLSPQATKRANNDPPVRHHPTSDFSSRVAMEKICSTWSWSQCMTQTAEGPSVLNFLKPSPLHIVLV